MTTESSVRELRVMITSKNGSHAEMKLMKKTRGHQEMIAVSHIFYPHFSVINNEVMQKDKIAKIGFMKWSINKIFICIRLLFIRL